jgi:Transposase DDE domain
MPVSGGGFEQTYNAQAAVDTKSKLIVAAYITQQSNDKLELVPTLTNLIALPKQLGTVTELLADSGYFSETNVNACVGEEITPYIAVVRQSHNRSLWERFKEPPLLQIETDSVTRMKHRSKTTSGKAVYALRKVTSEPVFGIIKAPGHGFP